MATKNKLLTVLSDAEQFALYGLPDFDEEQRLEFLSLSEAQLGVWAYTPILRHLGGKQASARLWPTTSGSVHLSRQDFPTVHPSWESKLTGQSLQGIEGLGQVHRIG